MGVSSGLAVRKKAGQKVASRVVCCSWCALNGPMPALTGPTRLHYWRASPGGSHPGITEAMRFC